MVFNLDELFVKLKFDVPNTDTEKISNFTSKVTALSTSFMAVRQFAGDAVRGINAVIQAVGDDSARLQSFNKQTGLSIDKLNEWRVAMYMGDPTQGWDKTIDNVQAAFQNLQKILIGAGDSSAFATLGISIFGTNGKLRDTYSIMMDLANVVAKGNVPLGIMIDRLQKAGFSSQSISGFKYMVEHYDEVKKYKDILFVSPENTKKITEVVASFGLLDKAWSKLWGDVLAADAPAIVDIVHDLVWVIADIDKALRPIGKFLQENKWAAELLLGALGGTALLGAISGWIKLINILKQTAITLGIVKVAAQATAAATGAEVAGGAAQATAAATGAGVAVTTGAEVAGGAALGSLAIPGVGEIIAFLGVIITTGALAYEVAKNQKVIMEDIKGSFDWLKDNFNNAGKEISSGKIIPDAIHLFKNLITPHDVNHQVNVNPIAPINLPKTLPVQTTQPTNVPANLTQTNHINITSHQPIEETKRVARETFNEGMKQVATNAYYLMPRSR